MLPLQFLYTHLHEIGHALAATATGGDHVRIFVFADGSGVTTSFGGSQLLTSPAGYIGATAMGAIILAMSRTVTGAQRSFQGLFFLMLIAMVAWIRVGSQGLVGYVFGLVFLLLFAWAGFRKTDGHTQWMAQFLGVFLSLSAIRAVLITMGIGGTPGEDDARILEKATGIPAWFSAVLWSAISLGLTWFGLRIAWRGR